MVVNFAPFLAPSFVCVGCHCHVQNWLLPGKSVVCNALLRFRQNMFWISHGESVDGNLPPYNSSVPARFRKSLFLSIGVRISQKRQQGKRLLLLLLLRQRRYTPTIVRPSPVQGRPHTIAGVAMLVLLVLDYIDIFASNIPIPIASAFSIIPVASTAVFTWYTTCSIVLPPLIDNSIQR